MVGDGSFLLMSSEIVTAIQEGYKLNVVLLDNHGFSSIGGLSQSVGSSWFRHRLSLPDKSGQLDGEYLPVDFVKLAEGYGAKTVRARTHDEAQRAIAEMRNRAGYDGSRHRSRQGNTCAGIRILVGCSDVGGIRVGKHRTARAAFEEAVKRERHHEIRAQGVTVCRCGAR